MIPASPRLAWVTDPHFNFVHQAERDSLITALDASGADAIALTGDISEAEDLCWQLQRFQQETAKPIYFVLGNHDFYRGSISATREAVRELGGEDSSELCFLTGAEPVRLSNDWTLCGEDGWADARIGNYFRSPVRMNDFRLIEDFQELNDLEIFNFLRLEGMRSAIRLRKQLEIARTQSSKSLVLTHVPPFREACWHEGKHSGDDWAPFFTCRAVGWMLLKFCERYPNHRVLVLCGHTHSGGKSQLADNLVVWTGAAEYGHPELNCIVDDSSFDACDFDWSATEQHRSNSDV
ncbi:MAG: metallophosphoesterase [Planctomycetota bacterium]